MSNKVFMTNTLHPARIFNYNIKEIEKFTENIWV